MVCTEPTPMQPIRPSDHYQLSKIIDVSLSPDEKNLVYVEKTPRDKHNYKSTIYNIDLEKNETYKLTPGKGIDYSPVWSPDGDEIAFISNRGDDQRTQIWKSSPLGVKNHQLTNVPGGVGRLSWSPDGEKITFIQESTPHERSNDIDLQMPTNYEANEPDPRSLDNEKRHVHRYDRRLTRTWDLWFDDARSHVYTISLPEKDVKRVTAGDNDHHATTWGDEDTIYYTEKRTNYPDDSMTHDIIKYYINEKCHEKIAETSHSNIWWPRLAASTDEKIAFTHMKEDRPSSRQTNVMLYDLTNKTRTNITENIDHTICRRTAPHFGESGNYVYFITLEEGNAILRRSSVNGTKHPELILGKDKPIAQLDRHRDVSISGNSIAFVSNSCKRPSDVGLASLKGDEATYLTNVNSEFIESRKIIEPEEVKFPSADEDLEIQGWVLHPPGFDETKSYPMIAVAHGGPHVMTTETQQWHEFQSYAAAGYVVHWCNYRGSTGYGQKFQEGNLHDWGGADYRDIMAGVEYISNRDYIDDERLYLTGMSYGGYLSGWAVGQTDLFSAAIAKSGFYCLPGVYGNTDKFKYFEWSFGTTPWEDPDKFWERSPVAHASEVNTPTLIVVGDNDYTTPLSDAECFHRYLKRNGVRTRLDIYRDEGHDLLLDGKRPVHVVDRFEKATDWFQEHS